MDETPKEKWKPLPLRRKFWAKLPQRIREGTVLVSKDEKEKEDIRNAAQSILIDYIEKELLNTFKRPRLDENREFYEAFLKGYCPYVEERETEIWEELSKHANNALKENPEKDLSEKEAAYLTLSSLDGHENNAALSGELYYFLAMHTRVYEDLLKEKHKELYTDEILYSALRDHMPKFLLRFIGLDSVIASLINDNAQTKESRERDLEDEMIPVKGQFEARMFYLTEDDSLRIKSTLIDEVTNQAKEKGIIGDQVGRTEDRGCPVLFASQRHSVE